MSRVQIFNIALNILGISTPLEIANSNDSKAILLNNYYELARDYVLKDFDWNFAAAYRSLTLCENQEVYSKFKYAYDYPNDCVCARDVFEKDHFELQKFSIASDVNGNKIILTDVEKPILRYTRKVEKEIYFSCEFSMALAHYLASLTSNVISGSIQKGELAYEKYRKILKRAHVLNAQEGFESNYDENSYIESRG